MDNEEPARPASAPPAWVECAEPLEGSYFVSTYPPFSTWRAEHLGRVESVLASRQEGAGPLGLYVHIPFCAKRCDYCYYLSYSGQAAERIDIYIEALLRELALYRDTPALAGRGPLFVYFGGGTPSLLSVRRLARLLEGLQALMPWGAAQEVTFECAPRSVTGEKLRLLRGLGVTRISLGVQQFDDGVLEANGRIHTVSDVLRAYAEVREHDFQVVNLDLMVGLVGETERTFFDGLDRTLEMQPDSVTIYPLEIPLNTPLYRALSSGAQPEPPAPWEVKRKRLMQAFKRLERGGYVVRSAYAAVRDPRRHLFVYQDELYRGADLLGLGAASYSYIAGVHYQNLATLEQYLESVGDGRRPLFRAHALSDEERCIREFVLQLKLGTAEASGFGRKFGVDITRRFADPLRRFGERGWLTVDDRGVRMSRDGLLRVDRLLPGFYLPEHAGVRYS